MFELVLTFFLSSAPIDRPVFEQRTVQYATAAECQAARDWWLDHPDAQLTGMAADFDLLIGPSCRSRAPLVG